VLGTGSFGEVVEGSYAGTPVAIKKARVVAPTGLDVFLLGQLFSPGPWRIDPCLACCVQLKSDPATAANCQEEIERCITLRHPNLVLVMGAVVFAQEVHIVMEHCRPFRIPGALGAAQQPSLAQRLDTFLDMCRGLAFLHASKVLHSDVKPANFLVSSQGVHKVTDFGMAKMVANTAGTVGVKGGTPLYAAPEVLRVQYMMMPEGAGAAAQPGGPRVTFAADVYAMGYVLYELLTGRPVFADQPKQYQVDLVHLLTNVVHGHQRPAWTAADRLGAAAIPEPWRHLVEAMWHRDATQRPTMLDIIGAIQRAQTERTHGRCGALRCLWFWSVLFA